MAPRKPLLSGGAIVSIAIAGCVASSLPFLTVEKQSLLSNAAVISAPKANEQLLLQGCLVSFPLLFDRGFDNDSAIHVVLKIVLLLSLMISHALKVIYLNDSDFIYGPLTCLVSENVLSFGVGSVVLHYASQFHGDKLTVIDLIIAFGALIASRLFNSFHIVNPEWSLIYDVYLYSVFFGLAVMACLIATVSLRSGIHQTLKYDLLYVITPMIWLISVVVACIYINGTLRFDKQSALSQSVCLVLNVAFTLLIAVISKYGKRETVAVVDDETLPRQQPPPPQSQSQRQRRVPLASPEGENRKKHSEKREHPTAAVGSQINSAPSSSLSKSKVWNSLSESGPTVKGPPMSGCFVDSRSSPSASEGVGSSGRTNKVEAFVSDAHKQTMNHASTDLMASVAPATPLTPLIVGRKEGATAASRLLSRPSPPSNTTSPAGGAAATVTTTTASTADRPVGISQPTPYSAAAPSPPAAATIVLTPLRAPATPARLSVSALTAAAKERSVTPTRRQHHIETTGEAVMTPINSPKEDYVRSLTVVSVMQDLVQKVAASSVERRPSTTLNTEGVLNPKPSVSPHNLKKISPIVGGSSSSSSSSGFTPLLHSHDILDGQDEVILLEHQAIVTEELRNKKDLIRQRRAAAAAATAAAATNGQKK